MEYFEKFLFFRNWLCDVLSMSTSVLTHPVTKIPVWNGYMVISIPGNPKEKRANFGGVPFCPCLIILQADWMKWEWEYNLLPFHIWMQKPGAYVSRCESFLNDAPLPNAFILDLLVRSQRSGSSRAFGYSEEFFSRNVPGRIHFFACVKFYLKMIEFLFNVSCSVSA